VSNPHALTAKRRSAIIEAGLRFADFWGRRTETVTFHGSKFPENGDYWDLGEVQCHDRDGRIFAMEAERIYSENGVDPTLLEIWESSQDALAGVHQTAWTFAAAEPWLALINVQATPTLVWHATTSSTIDYDAFEEWSAE